MQAPGRNSAMCYLILPPTAATVNNAFVVIKNNT